MNKVKLTCGALALLVSATAMGNLLPERLRFAQEQSFAAGKGSWFTLDVQPDWGALTVKVDVKVDNVTRGQQSWQTARVPMEFKDAKGKHVNPWPDVIEVLGTHGWKTYVRNIPIPAGTAKLHVGFSNYGATGTVSFRNASLVLKRKRCTKPCNAELPDGAEADPMSLSDAWTAKSATQRRICLNGLWQCRPPRMDEPADFVPGPEDAWGWAKIPSVWPEWRWKVFQATPILSPWFEEHPVTNVAPDRAWYGRTFVMPKEAEGKAVRLVFTMLNTRVVAYVDGKKAGTCVHPGGAIDLTPLVKPGAEQRLVLDFTAYPLDPVTLDFNAPDRSTTSKATVSKKGITGDVYLDIAPLRRITNAYVETSVKNGTITFVTEGLAAARAVATVFGPDGKSVRTFEGTGVRFTSEWKDAKLWDTHTPENRYTAKVALYDAAGKLLDESLPIPFGFREVTLDGRDIVLNGKTIHLRALFCPVPHPEPHLDAAVACKATCVELCRRLKAEGYNFIIAGNYSYAPGKVSHDTALLEACDEEGILYSYTLPHIKDFGVETFATEPVQKRYRAQVKWVIDRVRNHPSVLTWTMNHNCTGYSADQDPSKIDGSFDPANSLQGKVREDKTRNRVAAHLAWTVVKALDPTRPCYHHESGNLDDFHTINLYLNWAPRQERSDWLGHWHAKGVKPVFFVEWGMPHICTWSSFRGPEFIWRSNVYQSMLAMEGAAQFLGEAAYEATPEMHRALENEEKVWAKGTPPHWTALNRRLHALTNLHSGVQAHYMADNWRCHRAWGLSAGLPWDQKSFHRRIVPAKTAEDAARFRDLKRPGIVPDTLGDGSEFICDSGPRESWTRTLVGETMHRWNQPDCAFIGGTPVFTDKTHVYRIGSQIEKTLVVLNDNREAVTYDWTCRFMDAKGSVQAERSGKVTVPAGERRDVALSFVAPGKPGDYKLLARVTSATSDQTDDFALTVLPTPPSAVKPTQALGLYDPVGLTVTNFTRLGVPFVRLAAVGDLPSGATLVIGRGALTREIYEKDVLPLVRNRRYVLVFEQSRDVLSSIGFRVQEYGLRAANLRFADPRLKGFTDELIRDWAGESTLVPYYFNEPQDSPWDYVRRPWAGFMNTRVFRCGTRNAVATVIPEKPTCGDWRALADGGFDLQYAPLLEQKVGFGRVTFCQFDVTGRTVSDPAADDLVRALLSRRAEPYRGTPGAKALGVAAHQFLCEGNPYHCWEKDVQNIRWFLVSDANAAPANFADIVAKGAVALCVGLDAAGVRKVCPSAPKCADVKGRYFTRIAHLPAELNGLHNGHWAWHGAMDFAAFTEPAEDGNEAIRVVPHGKGRYVFVQVAPWQVDVGRKPYLRATRRRIEETLERVMGNLGFASGGGLVRYRDVPVADDDPYRYYRW